MDDNQRLVEVMRLLDSINTELIEHDRVRDWYVGTSRGARLLLCRELLGVVREQLQSIAKETEWLAQVKAASEREEGGAG